MVFDFGDRRERYLDDLAVGAFYLDARSGEGLSSFHASHNTPYALPVKRYDLNIVLAVQRLKGRKCFGDFHVYLFSDSNALGHNLKTVEILHRKAPIVYVAYNIHKNRVEAIHHECNRKASFGV